jgi:excisionase family DNA binding protein
MCPKANLNPKTTTATAAASATQNDDAYIQPLSIFIGAAEAARVLGVARKTVVRWAKSGRLLPHVLRVGQRGHWRFDRRALLCDVGGPTTTTASSSSTEEEEGSAKAERACGAAQTQPENQRHDVIYARISTRKQLQHLETQVVSLQARHPDCLVLRDCASGLNFRRKGLEALLQLVFARRVRNVYLAYRDRLCRFAYDLFERLFREFGATLCVDAHGDDAPESILADDILAIITVFGARLYGRRSRGKKGGQNRPNAG